MIAGRARLALLAVVPATAVGLASVRAAAHGDEPHGGGEAASAPARRPPSVGATGDLYEVLVKSQWAAAGEPVALRVFVADATSNLPVADAEVELTLHPAAASPSSAIPPEIKVVAKPAGAPGLYGASVTFPGRGDVDVVASVARGDDVDLVALGALETGPRSPIVGAVPGGRSRDHVQPGRWVAAAVAAGMGLALLVFLTARFAARRRRVSDG